MKWTKAWNRWKGPKKLQLRFIWDNEIYKKDFVAPMTKIEFDQLKEAPKADPKTKKRSSGRATPIYKRKQYNVRNKASPNGQKSDTVTISDDDKSQKSQRLAEQLT